MLIYYESEELFFDVTSHDFTVCDLITGLGVGSKNGIFHL